jgi:tetratricopeptide (TPR) repeat protein
MRLDSDYALLNLALGVTNYARNRDPIVMRQIVRLALRQSPADLTTLALSGWAYIWTCDNDAALDCLTKALRLGEFSPWSLSIRGGLSLASVQAGDNENAILFATEGLSISADYATLHRVLAAAYAHLGHEKRAEQAVKAALQADPEGSIQSILSRNFFADANTGSRYICGLRLAGMPE